MILTNTEENRDARISKTRIFVLLIIWWVAMAVFYMVIVSKERVAEQQIFSYGVGTFNSLTAGGIGIPLLERDVQSLSSLVSKISEDEKILFVSVLDHKNKIIAYTDAAQLLPEKVRSTFKKEGVSYWTDKVEDGTKAYFFSQDITFSDVRIGEIFLAVSAEKPVILKRIFFTTAVITLLLLFLLVLAVDKGLKNTISGLKKAVLEKDEPSSEKTADHYHITCPMCGSNKPLSKEFLILKSMDRFLLIRPFQNEKGSIRMIPAKGIMLDEITKRKDLGWLRQRMIFRCAEIIRKLAGDQF